MDQRTIKVNINDIAMEYCVVSLEAQGTINKLLQRIEYLEKQNYYAMVQMNSLKVAQYRYDTNEVVIPPWHMEPPNVLNTQWNLPSFSPSMMSPTFSPSITWSTLSPSMMSSTFSSSMMSSTYSPSMMSSTFSSSMMSSTLSPSSSSTLSQSSLPTFVSPNFQWSEANTTTTITSVHESVPTTGTALLPLLPTKAVTKVVVPTTKQKPPVPLTANSQSSVMNVSEGTNANSPISYMTAKENTPLPPINRVELISPQMVVNKYPKLCTKSKIPTLAVKLATEAFFGPKVMSYCTFKGVGSCHALPQTEVKSMKEFLLKLTMPGTISSRVEFENVWAKCVESVGQKCKTLRNLRLANMELK